MLKNIFSRMLSMCPEAWYIFIRSLALCGLLNICSLALMQEYSIKLMGNHRLYMLSMLLSENAQAVLLLGVIFSFLIEAVREP